MVRDNFKGILEWFPELTSVRKEMLTTPPPDHYTTPHSTEDAVCKAVNSRCEEKFSSPFSIESILKKNSLSALCCKASPLSEESSVSVEQKPNWSTERTVGLKRKVTCDYSPVDTHHVQCTGDSYNSYTTVGSSTAHGLTGNDAARPTKRKRMILMTPPSQQEKFNHCKTYLAMIAFILQDAPAKMLTFSQVRNTNPSHKLTV